MKIKKDYKATDEKVISVFLLHFQQGKRIKILVINTLITQIRGINTDFFCCIAAEKDKSETLATMITSKMLRRSIKSVFIYPTCVIRVLLPTDLIVQ